MGVSVVIMLRYFFPSDSYLPEGLFAGKKLGY